MTYNHYRYNFQPLHPTLSATVHSVVDGQTGCGTFFPGHIPLPYILPDNYPCDAYNAILGNSTIG